jgi:hypothetical protein
MGGSYGNLAALSACVEDARSHRADELSFLGDGIGCCGHSEEVVAQIRATFSVLVAGNHEQQAAARADGCGCGYASAEDEAVSCEAFRLATAALTDASREWLGSWPAQRVLELAGGRVLLCHGSPGHTSEFLYEHELDDLRLEAWLDQHEVRGFVCTHSGLPWVRRLRGGRFAVNCGAVGKADHDGDPAVHYALIDLPADGEAQLEIRRVVYAHEEWARRMEGAGIAPVFVEPIRTGVWTTGVASLPLSERHRYLRDRCAVATPTAAAGSAPHDWRPERLDLAAFDRVLAAFREMRLVTATECRQVSALLGPAFPFFAAVRLADSIHVHVKVDDVDALPHDAIVALGTHPENAKPGYVKYPFAGGVNLIFSSIEIAEEDRLPEPPPTALPKPYVDHFGIDLRRETGVVRAAFDDVPHVANRVGWAHARQGGIGRPVFCCHAQVAEKHWVYPSFEDGRFTRPVELAYGPLLIGEEMNGCDLRPVDPRNPDAAAIAACALQQAH